MAEKTAAPQRQVQPGVPHHTGAILLLTHALGAKKGFLDEAVKIINGTPLLPLSPCLFTIPCDKVSMNTFSRKDTCVIV